jgi:hypothetical protein
VELFTLVLSPVGLSAATKKGAVETVAMLSSQSSHKVQGPLQTYVAMCLSGTAENISF